MSKTVVIIGGGASGLLAAITAAREGAKVTILEQNNKLGKKILSTGNGRCNMTNMDQRREYYRSECPDFANYVLDKFSTEETLKFFRELGVYSKERNGYLYPRSNQAVSVVEALELEVRRLKIKCKTNEEAEHIEKKNGVYIVYTKTWYYECDAVILACGSKASAIEGSTGSGYILAKQLGHTIIEPLPALVGLRCEGNWFSKWAGVRCDARISLYANDQFCTSDIGEVQLTEYGVSGIPVFQISRYAAKALYQKQNTVTQLDFLPEMEENELLESLIQINEHDKNKNLRTLLLGLLPAKLIEVITNNCTTLNEVAHNIKNFSVSIKETMGFSSAQVCCGGISLEEINKYTMESKLMPGIYFCGELVDVDGACGGYNLQWAWSSGYVAGMSASKESL